MKKNSQSGQILLITLLVLSFTAIVVLSLIARTTTTQEITTQVDESAKALSAAEAGLELALQSHQAISDQTEPGVTFEVPLPVPMANSYSYILPEKTPKGGVAVIWLAPHKLESGSYVLDEAAGNDYQGNQLDVCWTDDSTVDAAVVMTLLYKDAGVEYKVGKGAFDPIQSPPRSQEFKWSPAHTDCPAGTLGQKVIFNSLVSSLQANDTKLMLRLRPLYNATQFSVYTQPNKVLPSQGNVFTSTGKTGSGTTRAVSVEEMYKAPGALFDYVIYSQNGDFAH